MRFIFCNNFRCMLLDTQLFLGKKHYSVKPYPAGRLGGPQLSFPAGVTMLNAVTV